ncbi:Putative Ca2+/H+ antiporter, TMEM165/GDT1 family [Pseudonocardia ammonioxydans]|uniref:Putative Ca2+/H+ antiporter, TMEM165/GDT1 family n=2 Tax=Pseudonocardia ammonioxydans TaxID=260086 RepID=A0A1I5IPG8_PSUAM|nr:Putative Ca2+/H+ antiporter, TMEM165/GDT1 family [Pseudonocardia ammonioxydans]
MDGFLVAFAVSFGVIFVAELGDKSQLMALTFATRFKAVPVLVGIALATSVTHFVSVAVGYGLGASIPTGWITLVAALAFLVFGAWTLRGDTLSEDEEQKARRAGGSAVVAASVAFFLAELGDKTMLATITLAAQHGTLGGSVGVWAGSTLGMVAADALAIVVGRQLGKRLPKRVISVGAAVLFVVFGAWLFVEAIPQVWGENAWSRLFAALGHQGFGWVALASGAIAVGVALWLRRRGRGERRLDVLRGSGSPAWWARTLFVVAAVLGFGAALLVALDVLEPISVLAQPAVAVIGAALLLVGFVVVAVAMRQLDTVWEQSVTEAGPATAGATEAARQPVLVTSGLYRRTRHPALTGVIVGCVGMLFMAPTLLGMLAGVLILVAVQLQARAVCEPGLASAFGTEYDAYRMYTGRFLPRVRPTSSIDYPVHQRSQVRR